MKSLTDSYKLSNGVEIPCVGFGTWKAENGELADDEPDMEIAVLRAVSTRRKVTATKKASAWR